MLEHKGAHTYFHKRGVTIDEQYFLFPEEVFALLINKANEILIVRDIKAKEYLSINSQQRQSYKEGLNFELERDSLITFILSLNDPHLFPNSLNFYCDYAIPNKYFQRLYRPEVASELTAALSEKKAVNPEELNLFVNSKPFHFSSKEAPSKDFLVYAEYSSKPNFIFKKPQQIFVVLKSSDLFDFQYFASLLANVDKEIVLKLVITGGSSFRILTLTSKGCA